MLYVTLFWFPSLLSRNILKTIALGQMLSLCICGTAITSQYLTEKYKVNTPMLQSFINYCLLFLIYTVMLAFQSGMSNVRINLFNKLSSLKFLTSRHLKNKTWSKTKNKKLAVFIKVIRKLWHLNSAKVVIRNLCIISKIVD